MNRGTKEFPFRNIPELKKGIIGKINCNLYTYGTWNDIPKDLLSELKDRNITLIGVGTAYLEEKQNHEQILSSVALTPDMVQKQLMKNLVDIKLKVDNASLIGLRTMFND